MESIVAKALQSTLDILPEDQRKQAEDDELVQLMLHPPEELKRTYDEMLRTQSEHMPTLLKDQIGFWDSKLLTLPGSASTARERVRRMIENLRRELAEAEANPRQYAEDTQLIFGS